MKNIKVILLLSAIFSLNACSFLDFDESLGQTEDYIYSYMDEAPRIVNHIYSYLPDDYATFKGAMREAATDNAVYAWDDADVKSYYDGSWSPVTPLDDVWGNYYTAIRAANGFLENYKIENFDRFKYEEDYPQLIEALKVLPNEARFLRAYFYFELIKRYKNVPLVTKVLTVDEVNKLQQSSFDDVVKFIIDECDHCAATLPKTYVGLGESECGRVTKGAALALKSRVTLYAASPLFNSSADKSLYKNAIDAAYDLIKYAREENIYSIKPETESNALWGFGEITLSSPQLILEARRDESNEFEVKNIPNGMDGGNSGNCPTQNLVEAYAMADGNTAWTEADGLDEFSARDPRLQEAVVVNGATLAGNTVDIYYNAPCGKPNIGATPTGYYIRKHINESLNISSIGQKTKKPHHFPLFRYAEVLLNYAEAMVEYYGDVTANGDHAFSAADAINEVRVRASVPAYVPTGSADEQKAFVRNERRVELAFEDHRFWDIRRWKIGDQTTKIYGVDIVKNEDGSFAYSKVLVQDRKWDDKMYLYPISQSELLKNTNLKQNPGW